MEFIIEKECFYKGISDVSKAVSSRTPFPILTGIKIIAHQHGLTLIGSNSDIVIEKRIPIRNESDQVLEVIQTGSVVASSKYMNEMIKKLPGKIHIRVNEKNVVNIVSDEVEINLNGFPSEEYPTLPTISAENKVRMKSIELIEAIQQTIFAVSKSDMNPILTGVNMSFTLNELTCAATNSHRLALKKSPIESNMISSATIPSVSLLELMKLMSQHNEMIDIYITQNYILFKSNTFSLYSRLIAGNYPKLTGFIPKDPNITIILRTKNLLKAVDRACLFASEWKNNNVRFNIKEQYKIILSSNSSEIGNIEETIKVEELTGIPELSISIDGNFMMDALKSIKDENVKISFGGPMSPILIEPAQDNSQLHVISPVRSR